jgi:hypothetical protein
MPMADVMEDVIKPTGPQCPQCHAACTADDHFCRTCGAYLREDAKAIDAYLARVVPERIDAALAVRFRDQKVVEVETAEKLAERAMGWLKVVGFFVGIPILVCSAVLSFLGIKTFSDLELASQKASNLDALVSNAEKQFGGVQKRVDELDGTLKEARSRIDQQIAEINTEQQRLQAQVASIQERLRFCPAKGLSADLKNNLQDKLGKFIIYLEKVGFQNLDKQVSVCVYSKDDPIQNPNLAGLTSQLNAAYSIEDRTIYIHQDMAAVASIALHEYTLYALSQVPNVESLAYDEVEFGLADYFPASFLDDPLIGETLGKLVHLSTSYIRNLATTKKYGEAIAEPHFRGEIWGAALWQCRHELGADVVDKITLQAWKNMNVGKAERKDLKTFSAALVKGEATTGKQTSCLSHQIAQRGLPS